MSYNQDGLLSEDEIKSILIDCGNEDTYKLYKIPYKQYQNKLTKKFKQ